MRVAPHQVPLPSALRDREVDPPAPSLLEPLGDQPGIRDLGREQDLARRLDVPRVELPDERREDLPFGDP